MEEKTNYEEEYKINTECDYSDENQYEKYRIIYEKKFNFINDDETLKNISENKNLVLNEFTSDKLHELYKNITPIEKIKKELLTYEFMYSKTVYDKKCENLDEIICLLKKELKDYQWIVGGFEIEDIEWTCCDETTRFIPNNNQRAIYNTVGHYENRRNNVAWFVDNIIRRISDNIDCEKYQIYCGHMYDKTHETYWLLLIAEQKID